MHIVLHPSSTTKCALLSWTILTLQWCTFGARGGILLSNHWQDTLIFPTLCTFGVRYMEHTATPSLSHHSVPRIYLTMAGEAVDFLLRVWFITARRGACTSSAREDEGILEAPAAFAAPAAPPRYVEPTPCARRLVTMVRFVVGFGA